MMAWWWWWCWWQGLRRRQWWIWWPWQWWWHQRRRWWWRWWRWWWRGRRWWCKARPPRQLPADPPTAKSRTTTISILSQPPPTSFSFLLLFDIFQHFNIFSISTTISTLYTTTNLIFILTFVHLFFKHWGQSYSLLGIATPTSFSQCFFDLTQSCAETI